MKRYDFELTYYDVTVKNVNHYAIRTPLVIDKKSGHHMIVRKKKSPLKKELLRMYI